MQPEPDQLNSTTSRMFTPFLFAGLAVIVVCLAGLRFGALTEAARLNSFAIRITDQIERTGTGSANPAEQAPALPETERLVGMLLLKQGDIAGADSRFLAAMRGSVALVPLVRAARPKSESLARAAYQLYPSVPDSPGWLADSLPDGDLTERLSLYRESAALEPADNLLWEKVGDTAATVGDDAVALDAYRRACDMNPIRNGSCHRAARYYYRMDDWQKVIYYFKRGLMPEHAPDWVLMIRAAQKLGLTDDAASYLAQAQGRNPDNYTTLLAAQP